MEPPAARVGAAFGGADPAYFAQPNLRHKRLALVHQIQKKLTEAGARPTVGWGIDHFAQWPHVKNLVPHNSLYNFGRMQEVWLDR